MYDSKEIKCRLVDYKGGKCQDCGGIFLPICYDFDHRDLDQKSFGIAEGICARKSLSELMEEADKCDLVCANCHRIRTANSSEIIGAKISAAKFGKKASLKARANMRAAKLGKPGVNLGRKHTPETRAKRLGRKHTLASRLKMSNSHKGKPSGNLGHKRVKKP
jgi:NUMOD3 motif